MTRPMPFLLLKVGGAYIKLRGSVHFVILNLTVCLVVVSIKEHKYIVRKVRTIIRNDMLYFHDSGDSASEPVLLTGIA